MLTVVLRWTVLLTATAAIASCRSPSTSGESETGDEGPEEVYPTPALVDPASGRLELLHSAVEEKQWRVSNFVPGRTQVRIDDKSVGTLLTPSPLGQFKDGFLYLYWHGGLVKGMHKIQLATPGTTGLLTSTDVDVMIESGKVPTLTHELDANPIMQADRILATGTGPRGVLLAVRATGPTDAELIIRRASGLGWSLSDARTVALPGYVHDQGAANAFVGVTVLQNEGEPDRLRLAWRVGLPGKRLDAREVVWGESENEVGEVLTVLDEDNLGPFEWTEIDAPVFIGPHLLVAAKTIANTEQALPGDRSVYALRWPDGDQAPHPGQRLNFGPLVDLDLLGPAIDVGRDLDDQVNIRTDRQYPRVLSWDASAALPRLAAGALGDELPPFANDPLGLATVLGMFGSRTVTSVYPGGTVRTSVVDTSAQISGWAANPESAALPDQTLTGDVAASIVRGTPVFLIPYGASTPVHAILGDGDRSHVQSLDGLYCDQLALPASKMLNLSSDRALACRQGQEVHVGPLFAGFD